VIRYARLTGDDRWANVIATTFTAAQSQHAKFVNTSGLSPAGTQ